MSENINNDPLKDFATELRTLVFKSNEYFEKQLNYISAGALGLSMVIVEKLIKDLALSQSKWMLFVSWSLLGLTLISNLVSHIFTSKWHNKTIGEIDDAKYNYSRASKRNRYINRWNLFSVALMLLGLFFQILFLIKNV